VSDKKGDNPWSKKTNSTSGSKTTLASILKGRSSSTSSGSTSSQKGKVSLSGLSKPEEASAGSGKGTGKTSLAKLSKRRATAAASSSSRSEPVTSSRPTAPTQRASTATRLNLPPRKDQLVIHQPFGGATLHSSTLAAHVKRARKLARQFPPGSNVIVEWVYDAAYARKPNDGGHVEGVVQDYDERGTIHVLGTDNAHLYLPSALATVRSR
jgi:hypothetical protein